MALSALTALILWQLTGNGLLAVIFAVLTDFLAAIPTLVKAWNHPASESANAYYANIVGGILTLLTINEWKLINYLFPLYIVIICFFIAFAINSIKLGLKKPS